MTKTNDEGSSNSSSGDSENITNVVVTKSSALYLSDVSAKMATRDFHGMFYNIDYILDQDKFVDWKKMLKPEHLAINKKYAKDLLQEHNVDNVAELDKSIIDDKYLLILLPGIKYLAKIRGYESLDFSVIDSSHDRVSVKCTIKWISNPEYPNGAITSDIASATLKNTSGFGVYFLEAIAANRAFVRCVRNFLGVNIVGFDELPSDEKTAGQDDGQDPNSPLAILKAKMSTRKKSLEDMKKMASAIAAGKLVSSPSSWHSLDKIPPKDVFVLLTLLKEENQS